MCSSISVENIPVQSIEELKASAQNLIHCALFNLLEQAENNQIIPSDQNIFIRVKLCNHFKKMIDEYTIE